MYEVLCIFYVFATAPHMFPEKIPLKSESSNPYTQCQIKSQYVTRMG